MKEEERQVLNCIVEKIKRFNPEKVILFGSFSTPKFQPGSSDVDLCIIVELSDKYETIMELYYELKSDLIVDFLLYTPEDWEYEIQDLNSFAYHIQRNGTVIYPEK